MTTANQDRYERTVRVGVADFAVGGPGSGRTFTTSGLGSCVAVALYKPNGSGGLLHAMLPAAPEFTPPKPGKYVDTGLDAMLAALGSHGVETRVLRAKLTGGSSMLDLGTVPAVGERNVAAARNALAAYDIPLIATETGGSAGRSIQFVPATGELTIGRADADPIIC